MSGGRLDAVVVGSGPNGLGAAITLARAGRSVLVVEGQKTLGGSVQSSPLTLPGFVHDVCSAVFPMGAGSPLFRSLPLAEHGLEWVGSDLPLAHALDGGRDVVMRGSLEDTAALLGPDGAAYARSLGGIVELWRAALAEASGAPEGRLDLPSLRSWRSRQALLRALPGALRSAAGLARARFRTAEARALVAGLGTHGMQPLSNAGTGGFVLSLAAAAHAVGWPIVRGGAQRLTECLAAVLRAAGGAIEADHPVRSLERDLPPSRVVLLDVGPGQLLRLAGRRLSARDRRRLAALDPGLAAFKIDYALRRPIPWTAERCRRATVVHVGGDADEVEAAMLHTWNGTPVARPFVLVSQPSLLDRSRVPAGSDHEVAWTYCHVPVGSSLDMSAAIEDQLERFAPGFKSCVLARHVMGPRQFEAHNPNLEGGDIGGGACDLWHLLLRPAFRLVPWTTSDERLFLCSASTPPGPGVHGMCGYFAARTALRALERRPR
jgi:phytoene dehydrogenase-like protein